MRSLPTALLCTALTATVLAGCGSSGGSKPAASSPPAGGGGSSTTASSSSAPAASGGGISAPCDVTDTKTVTSVFGGTSAPEKAGTARNCEYDLTGASAPKVNVFYYGDASEWDGQKAAAKSAIGTLTPVAVGDDAYSAKGLPNVLTVKADGAIFAVQVIDFSSRKDYLPQLTKLAKAIVAEHG